MARLLRFLLAALITFAAAPAAAEGAGLEAGLALEIPGGKVAIVRLREEAEVAGEQIRLGDVAEVAAREAWLQERLEELVVGGQPLFRALPAG